MGNTKIEWCDRVWNPITGCSPISEGCRNCYVRRMANRLKGRCGYPKDDPFRVTFHPDKLQEPLHWKKPSRVFVCSMGDLFHEDVERQWIDQVMSEIVYYYEHTFLILTKRPIIAQKYFANFYPICMDSILPNLWLGVSVATDKDLWMIEILLQIVAAKRFVSAEPMLGPVDLTSYLPKQCPIHHLYDCCGRQGGDPKALNWVICGGLSLPGGKIQPPEHEWLNSLIKQCDGAGVPIFIKPNAKYPIERKDFPK